VAANGRSTYTVEDKARVLAVLAANDGNIKRTARETGVPVNTVRRWKTQDAAGAGPPTAVVVAAVGEFVDDAQEVRGMALAQLKVQVASGHVSSSDLIKIVGILDDKVRLAKGMATARTEHVGNGLPAPEQVRELMSEFAAGLIEGARRTHEDIVEAELVAEIPATSSAE